MASREPRPAPFRPAPQFDGIRDECGRHLRRMRRKLPQARRIVYAAFPTIFTSKMNKIIWNKSMTRITGRWLAAPLLGGAVLWAGAAEAAAYSADPTTY